MSLVKSGDVVLLHVCLINMMLVGSQAYAQDVLNQQRLFFTPQERQIQGLSNPTDESKSEVSSTVNIVPAKLHSIVEHNTDFEQSDTITDHSSSVFFSGLVSGTHSVQVLINGMPCRSIPVTTTIDSDSISGSRINCPHLQPILFTLFLNQHAEQITVQLKRINLVSLNVGQGFRLQ